MMQRPPRSEPPPQPATAKPSTKAGVVPELSPMEQAFVAQLRALGMFTTATGDLVVRIGKRASCRNAFTAFGLAMGLIAGGLLADRWFERVQIVLIALGASWLLSLLGSYADERRAARRARRLVADQAALAQLKAGDHQPPSDEGGAPCEP